MFLLGTSSLHHPRYLQFDFISSSMHSLPGEASSGNAVADTAGVPLVSMSFHKEIVAQHCQHFCLHGFQHKKVVVAKHCPHIVFSSFQKHRDCGPALSTLCFQGCVKQRDCGSALPTLCFQVFFFKEIVAQHCSHFVPD